MMQKQIDEFGIEGMCGLMKAAGKSQRTIERYISGKSKMAKHRAFLLADSLGCSHAQAEELANEVYLENKGELKWKRATSKEQRN